MGVSWILTVKLRGRTTMAESAEGAQFLSARGAKPQARHGPLQRLLERMSDPLRAIRQRKTVQTQKR